MSELEALMNQPGARDNLETLVSDALLVMKRLGYSKTRINQCRCVWKALAGFAETKGFTMFSEELCERFLANYDIPDDTVWLPMRNYPHNARTIVLMLKEFYLNGCWKVRYVQTIIPLPASLSGEFNDFLRYWKETKLVSQSTISYGKRYLSSFLRFLDAHEIHSWSELHPALLSKFFTSQAHLSLETIKSMTYVIRSFLKYLFINEILSEDLSWQVPKIRIPCEQHLPSVWTRTEVESLLAAVDRGSPVGKRDYAILLLACRLGMRGSDIRNLRLENLRWDESRIVLNQSKTGNPLTLPLTNEVGEAIIDYLRHVRPSTSYREVFLRIHAPIQPFAYGYTFYDIITIYRRRAGILLPTRSKKGLHSLRHTVACRLLEADTPLETISDILGHASLESTRTYARADISSLRTAALDPEELFNA